MQSSDQWRSNVSLRIFSLKKKKKISIIYSSEKLIKDLKEENQRLKKMLESGKIDPALLESMKNGSSGGGSSADPKNDEAMKKMLDDNEKQMQAMQKTYEEKLAEANNKVIYFLKFKRPFYKILMNL